MEAHCDVCVRYCDIGGHVDQITKNLPRLSIVVASHSASG